MRKEDNGTMLSGMDAFPRRRKVKLESGGHTAAEELSNTSQISRTACQTSLLEHTDGNLEVSQIMAVWIRHAAARTQDSIAILEEAVHHRTPSKQKT